MSIQNPKISIITVAKNSETTIEKSIQSVLSQNYHPFEYIIIDGDSDDNTMNLINKYKNSITTIISEPDDGIYEAMNKGINIATGEIIGILNSDDQYLPNTLNSVAKQFSSSSVCVGYCIRNNPHTERSGKFKEIRFQKKKPLSKLKYVMALDHPAMFIPKCLYGKYGKYDSRLKICADYKWTANAWSKGCDFNIIDQALTIFSTGGISDTNRIQTSIEMKNIQIELGLLSPISANIYLLYRIINRITLKSFVTYIKNIIS